VKAMKIRFLSTYLRIIDVLMF